MLGPCQNESCANRRYGWLAVLVRQRGIRLDNHWYCSPECFEEAIGRKLADLVALLPQRKLQGHRVPLGLMLLARGDVTAQELKEALRAQREAGSGRVGEWLRRHGAVSEQQVTAALGMQWARPILPCIDPTRFLECACLIPLPLAEDARMAPLHYQGAGRLLYVAFADAIDYCTLHGIEQMLDCRTEPCLAAPSAIDWALGQLRAMPRPAEMVFEDIHEPRQMAQVARDYSVRLHAEETRLVACGRFIWLQIRSRAQTHNLLFHLPAEQPR
jgi:hypothetical protein